MRKSCRVSQRPVTSGTSSIGHAPPQGGGSQIPKAQRMVTSNVTCASPAADSATTRQGPSAAWEVTRKACALPPAPVFAVAVRETPALQWALAMAGSVNVMVSPSMGAPVSASSSRTFKETVPATPASVEPCAPSAETDVAGVGTTRRVRRSGTTSTANATGAAARSGAVTAR